MAVQVTDIKFKKSIGINNATPSANGGKRSENLILTRVMNNLFPNVSPVERVSGVQRWRKFFVHNINAMNLAFVNAKMFIHTRSTGEDIYALFAGGADDHQSDYYSDVVFDLLGGYRYSCGSKVGSGVIAVGDAVTIANDASKKGIVTDFVNGSYIVIRPTSEVVSETDGIFENADVVCLVSDHTTHIALTSARGVRSPHLCTTGNIMALITAGDSSMAVDFFNQYGARGHIMPGDTIFISSLENSTDLAHSIEFCTVKDVTWVSSDTVATCVITTVDPIVSSYSINNTGATTYKTRVGKVADLGTLASGISDVVKSFAGAANFIDTNVIVNNYGAKQDNITITFTNATTYVVTGENVASYGTGTIIGTFSPVNPDNGQYYFQIPPGCWEGSPALGDNVQATINPADAAVWAIETVPALSASSSDDTTGLMCVGEGA